MTETLTRVNHVSQVAPLTSAWTVPLRDGWGRTARDLRLSVTDRCDLRCSYCLPRSGVKWVPRRELLDVSEILRLAGIAIRRLGITQVRLTGGEPLLRPDLLEIAAGVRESFVSAGLDPQLALTTNARSLAPLAAALRATGIRRINISLDTLDPNRFAQIAGRDELAKALAGIDAALSAGFQTVKMNTVMLDRVSLREAPELLRFCLERGIEWRAIEYMPFGPHAVRVDSTQQLDFSQLRPTLEREFHLEPVRDNVDIHAPATRFDVFNSARTQRLGTMGIISSVSAPFCANCNRTRLSPTGVVRPCLFSDLSCDLGMLLRSGASDDELAQAWAGVTWEKPSGHGLGQQDFHSPTIPMAQIGG